MVNWLSCAALATVAALAAAPAAEAQSAPCFRYGRPCPASAPFCSAAKSRRTCSSMLWDGYIENGCTANASQPNACVPKPKCKSMRVDFNAADEVPNRDKFLGDPDKQPFIDDTGNVGVGAGEMLLRMRFSPEVQSGLLSRVISTRSVHYGTYSARVRMSMGKGLVYTWIFKTDSDDDSKGDEIDWEFVPGSSNTTVQTNVFIGGVIDYTKGGKHALPEGKFLSDAFTYKMVYMPDRVEWWIDNTMVRSLSTAKGDKLPNQEGRLFFSIWDSCRTAPGTVSWAGGPTSWCNNTAAETTKSEFRMAVDWVDIQCAPGFEDTKAPQIPQVAGGAANSVVEGLNAAPAPAAGSWLTAGAALAGALASLVA